MKRLASASIVFVLCGWLVAYGGSLASLCQDSLSQNRQPGFADGGFQSLKTVQVVGNPAVLRLNTNLDVLNPQKIMLPFDQNVSISYVYQAGGAGWALGWMYADDLVKRGYMDANGNLLDADGDGIPDFHEDIYNVSPSRYVGKFRKCGASPPTFTWNGKSLIEPEVASDTCGSTFGTTSKSAFQADGGIGTVSGWQVGKASGASPPRPPSSSPTTGCTRAPKPARAGGPGQQRARPRAPGVPQRRRRQRHHHQVAGPGGRHLHHGERRARLRCERL